MHTYALTYTGTHTYPHECMHMHTHVSMHTHTCAHTPSKDLADGRYSATLRLARPGSYTVELLSNNYQLRFEDGQNHKILRVTKNIEPPTPCDTSAVMLGSDATDLTALATKPTIPIGPAQTEKSEKSLRVTGAKGMIAKLTPLKGTMTTNLSGQTTEVPLSATPGEYQLSLLYDRGSAECVLLRQFTVDCASGYTRQGPVCAASCSHQGKKPIGPQGACARAQAEVSIRSASVSRWLYKPSAGLTLDGNLSAAEPARIQLKASDEFDFSWRSVMREGASIRHGPVPASFSAESILLLSKTAGIVNISNPVETIMLNFNSQALDGWNESDVIHCNVNYIGSAGLDGSVPVKMQPLTVLIHVRALPSVCCTVSCQLCVG